MKIDNVSHTNMRSLSCACQHSMSNKPAAICVNDLSKTFHSLISFFPSFQPRVPPPARVLPESGVCCQAWARRKRIRSSFSKPFLGRNGMEHARERGEKNMTSIHFQFYDNFGLRFFVFILVGEFADGRHLFLWTNFLFLQGKQTTKYCFPIWNHGEVARDNAFRLLCGSCFWKKI